MKRIEFSRHGAPHAVCACVEVAEPAPPGAGEVLVAIEAAPINPADLLIVEDRYPGPATLPAPLGIEGVGRVLALGEGVAGLAPGDRVMSLGRANWAERVTLAAAQAIRLPETLDLLQAAQIKVNPPSAQLMLEDYVELASGDWVVQNAANSAVGRHLIRLARERGVRTLNVVRRESLVEPLTAIGADQVLCDGEDLAARARERLGDARVALAVDAVGGPACLRLAQCLSDGGVVVNYGFLSGEPCMITPHQAIVRGISLHGFWLVKRLFGKPRETIEATYAHLAGLFESGVLYSPVEATYPLEQAAEALAHAAREGRDGKVLFTPGGRAA